MIPKIKNLKISKTEKQERDSWDEIKSYRNKFLSNSDWTQLTDSMLTTNCAEQYASWRASLKKINRSNFATKEQAEESLRILAKKEPRLEYVNTTDDDLIQHTLVIKKALLVKELNYRFIELLDGDSFETHAILIDEQFNEAVDYKIDSDLVKKIDDYPLIKLEVELSNMKPNDIADAFLLARRTRLKNIITLKRKFAFLFATINNSNDMVHLDDISREIKRWTLISI